ncbi:hypothetical protein WCE41_09445 [Luteimonas sp. MJ246]|uniref:hypothetical protein n=1 Tax=Luteimonas sp. MJ174 TaxID=3129237 RepID=UPI0031BA5679
MLYSGNVTNKDVDMERIFRAATLLGLASLAACGAAGPNPAHATSPVAGPIASGVDMLNGPAMSDEIHGVLPRGAEVLAVSQGDINADGRPDVVVALDSNADAAGARLPRSMLLFVRDAEGQLQLAARNDRIVPCAECGGSLGEPSIHLVSGPGSFMVRTEGGAGWLWSNEYSFEHSGNNTWQLVSVSRMSSHRVSHETSSSNRTADDFGQMDFVDFDPETIDDTALPRE